jgi:SAM-dependent methyltransferase
MSVFWEIHSNLPREGPGNTACVARALAAAQPLPSSPDVLDIACGPGGQTLDLASLLPGASIVAVDAHKPFLNELERRAPALGFAKRIRTYCCDMRAMDFAAESFDLLWCEGAAYILSLENALRDWRALLRLNGKLALSEPVWLTSNPPSDVVAFWAEYPQMRDITAVRTLVKQSGYRLLEDFALPEEAWWDNYYTPMEKKLPALWEKHKDDPKASGVIAEAQYEIDMYRKHSAMYGYLFVVLQKETP